MLIAITGNICTGKTTLSQAISLYGGFYQIGEPIEENPFIRDFYVDMRRWAFPTQLYFMSTRASLLREASIRYEKILMDRSISEDISVFSMNLHELNIISDSEYRVLSKTYELINLAVPTVDFYIYLYDRTEVLYQRTVLRGRPFENKMELEYLNSLNDLYRLWRNSLPSDRVMDILSSDYDFRQIQDQAKVLKLIQDRIAALNTP